MLFDPVCWAHPSIYAMIFLGLPAATVLGRALRGVAFPRFGGRASPLAPAYTK